MNVFSFNKYFKLYLKCILRDKSYVFIENLSQQSFKNDSVLLTSKDLYYLTLHLRLSSLFYSSQLVDIFSYEVPRGLLTNSSPNKNTEYHKYALVNRGASSVLVYNFHVLTSQERFYIFLLNDSLTPSNLNVSSPSTKVTSITELFFAANWLERELSELSGVAIKDKKDLRNLMLQYGDSSAPFQKSFPSVGLKEMFYNPLKDTIIQNPVSLQL
jgi:NADH:ubiquinone oxidoreductase subunit C